MKHVFASLYQGLWMERVAEAVSFVIPNSGWPETTKTGCLKSRGITGRTIQSL